MGILGGIGCGLAGLLQDLITGLLQMVLGGAVTNAVGGNIAAIGLVLFLVFILWRLAKSHMVLILLIFVIPFLTC